MTYMIIYSILIICFFLYRFHSYKKNLKHKDEFRKKYNLDEIKHMSLERDKKKEREEKRIAGKFLKSLDFYDVNDEDGEFNENISDLITDRSVLNKMIEAFSFVYINLSEDQSSLQKYYYDAKYTRNGADNYTFEITFEDIKYRGILERLNEKKEKYIQWQLLDRKDNDYLYTYVNLKTPTKTKEKTK